MSVNSATFRLAVVFLGIALLTCIGGIVALSALHDAIPSVLDTTVGVVGGALAGLFVTPHDDPQPVTVANQPVVVTEKPRRGQSGHADVVTVLLVVLVVVVVLVLLGVAR